jgi:hypothetical protein
MRIAGHVSRLPLVMTMTGHSEQTIATPLHGPPLAAFGCRIDTSVPDEPRSFPNFPQKRIAFGGGDIDIGKRTGVTGK